MLSLVTAAFQSMITVHASQRLASFHEVAGISQEEIDAITALQNTREYFIFGMLESDEAFFTIDGEVSGFAAELSNWLSDIFGIPFIPVIFTWSELISGLEDGSIDFTGQLSRTPERELTYAMASPIAMRSLSFAQHISAERLHYIAGERPPRLIFYDDMVISRLVRNSSNIDEFHAVYVQQLEDIYELLVSGAADAFICDSAAALAAAFPDFYVDTLRPFVFSTSAFSARDPQLFPIVSVVQKAIESGSLSDLADLYAASVENSMRHRFSALLSDEEKEFIENNPIVPFSAYGFSYPIVFYNNWNNEFQGIALDILKQVEIVSGLNFEISHQSPISMSEIMQKLDDGQTLLAAGTIRDNINGGYTLNYAKSDAFFSDRFALLSRSETANISVNELIYHSIGTVENSVYDEIFTEWFPQYLNLHRFPDESSVITALESGEIDLFFTSLHVLLRMTNFLEQPGFRANLVFGEYYYVSFAINENAPLLHSIINKSLSIIDTDDISAEWMSKTFDYTLRFLENQRIFYSSIAVLLTCVLVLLFMLFYKTYTEKHKLSALVRERTNTLSRERVMLETVLETMPDLLFCKDLNANYTRINKSFEEFFGINREDSIGLTAAEIHAVKNREYREAWSQSDQHVFRQKKTIYEEEILYSGDGVMRHFEAIKTPLLLDGELIGLLGLKRDITRHKEIEAELRAASAAKTEFIANMSHETRTPMNSIVGFSELALDDETTPKTRAYLEKIIENAHWLLQIINDILDISKIESGKIELENIPFSLEEILSHCESVALPKAIEKGISLHFDTTPMTDNKLVVGDPYRLRQVFINLITNAIKFTEFGEVKVTSRIITKTEHSKTIRFEIADSGIGMTPDQIQRISEPFMQADSSITRKHGGTGLGIPIVNGILAVMGTQLNIESTPGIGSKFSFQLDFHTTASSEFKVNLDIDKPYFSGEILVCEDNEMNQLVISEHLRRIGLSYVIAGNGQEGVELVSKKMEKGEKPFDLILMDVHMPVMDGLEATKRITRLGISTPIVAITANVMSYDFAGYKKAGMTDWIGKPFTSQQLWKCLLKYLTPSEKLSDSNEAFLLSKDNLDGQLKQLLVKSFVRDNQDIFVRINDSIKQGKLQPAHRLVHTLKSSAGLIGKHRLQSTAAELEKQLLKDAHGSVSDDSLHTLEAELKLVLKELLPIADSEPVPEENTEPETRIINTQELKEQLNELENMLRSRNAGCLQMLPAISKLHGSQHLCDLIAGYDFKAALKELIQFKTTMGI